MNSLHWSKFNVLKMGERPGILNYVSVVVLMFVLLGLGYWFMIQSNVKKYDSLVRQEQQLRREFETKHQQAAHLKAYRQQLQEIKRRLNPMLKQLSKRYEMPGVLEEISNTGKGSGLTFELFAPQPEVLHDFYSELPIHLVVVGRYHQLADFLSQIGQMKRIVTVHDFEIRPYTMKMKSSDVNSTKQVLKNQMVLLSMTMLVKIYWVDKGGRARRLTKVPSAFLQDSMV